jgi:hypothetical protein
MLSQGTQAALLMNSFAAQAVGDLYRNLGFIQRTNVWKTEDIEENGGIYKIPVIGGNLVANDRTGTGDTVDQTPNAAVVDVPIIEKHVAFRIDPNWMASAKGQQTVQVNLLNAVKTVAKAFYAAMFQAFATTSGLQSVGTLGTAYTLANWDSARKALVDVEADYENFIALISTTGMNDLKAIPQFADFNVTGVAGIYQNGQVAKADNFLIFETPRIYSPSPGQAVGLAMDPSGIWTVFPKQHTFAEGGNIKVEQEFDGIRMTVLQEYVPGKGGSWRWVVMVTGGFVIGNKDLVIKMNGR